MRQAMTKSFKYRIGLASDDGRPVKKRADPERLREFLRVRHALAGKQGGN
ncbi:protein of unknown function (plasmid) [Cupriavidus taiwanensis]|uniref:Uncharacterized protein n=1 Tax=Cupriavidus taiwanensis TaxID=164546 RepID=A0A375IRC4_9BURK|nr:protein of unknown function [Cupriavidus taiwanensis]